MSPLSSRALERLASWKWVLGYTTLLLLTLTPTRRFLDWLEQRGLAGLQAFFLLFTGIGCLLFLFRRIRRTEGGFTLSAGLRLFGFLCLYVSCMFLITDLTVDRIHFVEYGVLGLLCLHSVSPRHGPVRRLFYAMTAVFAVAFLDESVQGFLASRYYALRDVAIDLVAGFLPLLGLYWLPLRPREERGRIESMPAGPTPRRGRRRILPQASDAGPVFVTLLLAFGVLWVERDPQGPEPLYGAWERENRCGRIERIRIGTDGTVLWEDAAGGRAKGRYRVGGNRLDGPLFELEVLEGQGSGPCAWATGERRDRYYEVAEERLTFKKEREWPFRRIELLTE